jgi:hypothetical protein
VQAVTHNGQQHDLNFRVGLPKVTPVLVEALLKLKKMMIDKFNISIKNYR